MSASEGTVNDKVESAGAQSFQGTIRHIWTLHTDEPSRRMGGLHVRTQSPIRLRWGSSVQIRGRAGRAVGAVGGGALRRDTVRPDTRSTSPKQLPAVG